jgi:hypothetical protein
MTRSSLWTTLAALGLAASSACGGESGTDEADDCVSQWSPVRCEDGKLIQSDGCGNQVPTICTCGCDVNTRACIQPVTEFDAPLPAECSNRTDCVVFTYEPSDCEEDKGASYSLHLSSTCDQAVSGVDCMIVWKYPHGNIETEEASLSEGMTERRWLGCSSEDGPLPVEGEIHCVDSDDDKQTCLTDRGLKCPSN